MDTFYAIWVLETFPLHTHFHALNLLFPKHTQWGIHFSMEHVQWLGKHQCFDGCTLETALILGSDSRELQSLNSYTLGRIIENPPTLHIVKNNTNTWCGINVSFTRLRKKESHHRKEYNTKIYFGKAEPGRRNPMNKDEDRVDITGGSAWSSDGRGGGKAEPGAEAVGSRCERDWTRRWWIKLWAIAVAKSCSRGREPSYGKKNI